MAIPTIQLTVNVQDQTGAPVAGAVVYAQLNQPDLYNGQYVEPVSTRVVADGTGAAVLTLFPNALGSGPNGPTYYNIRAFNADESKRIFGTTAYLPNANINLSAVYGTLPAPSPPDLPMTPNVLPIIFGGTGAATPALAAANLGLTGAATAIPGQVLFGGNPTGVAQDTRFTWDVVTRKLTIAAAVGSLLLGGAPAGLAVDGTGWVATAGPTLGLVLVGRGTIYDFEFFNRSIQPIFVNPAGSQIVEFPGTVRIDGQGSVSGDLNSAGIQFARDQMISWRGASGQYGDGGYIWYSNTNSLNFGTNNTNQMQLGSDGTLSNPQQIHTPIIDSGLAASLSLRTANGSEHVRVGHLGGTLVNFLKMTGGPTGTAPAILAQGTDSNVSLTLGAQGANCSIVLSATSVIVSGGSLVWGTGIANFGTIVKRKTADESVTNSVVLQDDDHLTFSIAANEEWVADFFIDMGAALLTTGVDLAITVPSGATMNVIATCGNNVFRTSTSGSPLTFAASGFFQTNPEFMLVSVWVLNGANAGSVTLRWCQDTSNALALTFRKGSHMTATRIA